jgi:adenylate cyclase
VVVTRPDDPRARFEQAVLRGRRRYTPAQLQRVTGLSEERTRRLWRAVGFSDVADDDVWFTDGDVNALNQLEQLRATGLVPLEVQEAVIRSIAVAMSGLADWQVNWLYQRAGNPTARSDPEHALTVLRGFLPALERLQDYIWRRRLVVAAQRAETLRAAQRGHQRVTVVGSADLVGFTRATRRLAPDALVQLVEGFHTLAIEVADEHDARVVKTIGDEVLFVADRPAEAADMALMLVERAVEAGMPELRVGMALGPVLRLFGDVYGEVVHLAALLGGHARPGRVLVDQEMADALADDPRFVLRLRRSVSEPGSDPLPAWGLRRAA